MRDDLDTLIQASRIEVEASSTLPRTVMVQVQRRSQIRRMQWLLLLLLVLAMAAFAYGVSRSKVRVLIEAIINGSAQRSQNLYVGALVESLPLIQLIALLSLILIVSLMPKLETILLRMRKRSVTKGSNMAFKVRTSGIIAMSFALAVIAGSIVLFPANGGKELAKLEKVTHGQGVALSNGVDQKPPHVSRPPSMPAANPAVSELSLKEWGVKVKVRDASKLSYSVDSAGGSQMGVEYEGVVKPLIKAEFLQNKSCEIGVSIFRSKLNPASYRNKKIGDYYYFITGGPGGCSDDPENNPDDQLKTRILADLVPENIFAE